MSYFFPLIVGAIGLYFIRIEYSGIRILDNFNKSVNSTTFNAVLTLLIIFILLKYTPPLLNWLIFDADFIGSVPKKIVQVMELVGFLLKFGLKDLCMECIQIQNNGE